MKSIIYSTVFIIITSFNEGCIWSPDETGPSPEEWAFEIVNPVKDVIVTYPPIIPNESGIPDDWKPSASIHLKIHTTPSDCYNCFKSISIINGQNGSQNVWRNIDTLENIYSDVPLEYNTENELVIKVTANNGESQTLTRSYVLNKHHF